MFEEERQRAETLAEPDRAKISFFSSISHEFCTPLTLMLSPLEQTIAEFDRQIPAKARSQLELLQRNGKRLLKLVNTHRVESAHGRMFEGRRPQADAADEERQAR